MSISMYLRKSSRNIPGGPETRKWFFLNWLKKGKLNFRTMFFSWNPGAEVKTRNLSKIYRYVHAETLWFGDQHSIAKTLPFFVHFICFYNTFAHGKVQKHCKTTWKTTFYNVFGICRVRKCCKNKWNEQKTVEFWRTSVDLQVIVALHLHIEWIS